MLNFNRDHPGKTQTGPLFIKVVCFLLYNFIITDQIETLVGIRFQVFIRWCSSPASKIRREMTMKDCQWIFYFRMRVPTFGKQHMSTEKHGPSPKLRKKFALNFYMPDIFRIFGCFNGGNCFSEKYIVNYFQQRVEFNFYRY